MDNQGITHEFTVILLGDGGVGKTSFFKKIVRQRYCGYDRRYSCEQFMLQTNRGLLKINLFDTCGEERFGGLRQGYYLNGHAAIIMFDVTSRISYKNIPKWYRDFRRVRENMPIVIVGNKVDSAQRKVKPKQIKFQTKKNLPYFEISVKCNYGFEKLLECVASSLLRDENVQIIKTFQLKPASQEINKEIIDKTIKQWEDVEHKDTSEDQF